MRRSPYQSHETITASLLNVPQRCSIELYVKVVNLTLAFGFLHSFVTCSLPTLRSQPQVPLQLSTALSSIFIHHNCLGPSYSKMIEQNSVFQIRFRTSSF